MSVLHISKAGASGLSVYVILRREGDNFRWIVGDGFEAYNAANLDSYDIPLADDGGDVYSADVDFTAAAAGRYISKGYIRRGATPAPDDYPLPGEVVYDWTGTALADAAFYATRSDVEAKIGVKNVASLADLNANKDANEIGARINDALQVTFDEMNGRIRAAGFAIPLAARGTDPLPYNELRSIHADLAADELMSAHDATQPVNDEAGIRGNMETRRQKAERKLRLLILNGLTMATRIASGGPSGPVVVTDRTLAERGIANTWIGNN